MKMVLIAVKEHLLEAPVGFYSPKDDFFLGVNTLFTQFQKLGVMCIAKEETVVSDVKKFTCTEFNCSVPNCGLSFESGAVYQTHFNRVHRYTCSECRRAFPISHLLDLHISEQHDSYFAACVTRDNEPKYKCFLTECTQKMLTPAERKEHCKLAHHFPPNFRFDRSNVHSMALNSKKSTCATVVDDYSVVKVNVTSTNQLNETPEVIQQINKLSFRNA